MSVTSDLTRTRHRRGARRSRYDPGIPRERARHRPCPEDPGTRDRGGRSGPQGRSRGRREASDRVVVRLRLSPAKLLSSQASCLGRPICRLRTRDPNGDPAGASVRFEAALSGHTRTPIGRWGAPKLPASSGSPGRSPRPSRRAQWRDRPFSAGRPRPERYLWHRLSRTRPSCGAS